MSKIYILGMGKQLFLKDILTEKEGKGQGVEKEIIWICGKMMQKLTSKLFVCNKFLSWTSFFLFFFFKTTVVLSLQYISNLLQTSSGILAPSQVERLVRGDKRKLLFASATIRHGETVSL